MKHLHLLFQRGLRRQATHPLVFMRMTSKNLTRIGAQAPERSLPLGQLGAVHKPSESSLKTSHPWAEEASVVVRTGARSLENDHFSTQILTWACKVFVIECQCFPNFTCL